MAKKTQKCTETSLKHGRMTRILQRDWLIIGATTNQSNLIGWGGRALTSHYVALQKIVTIED